MTSTVQRAARRRPDLRTTMAVVVSCVAALYFLFPIYWLVIAATKDSADLFGSFGFWFHDFRLGENLVELFTYQHGIFGQWVANTFLYSFVGSVVATILAVAAGYFLAKFAFRGREVVFKMILGGVFIPITALVLPLYLLMSQLGLANTYWAVLLPAFVSPFGVYLARLYTAASVPNEIIEAGRIDGAGELRIFFTVTLRMLMPAVATIFLFHFIGTWNSFFLPLVMLSNARLYPLNLGLSQWLSEADRMPVLYQMTVTGSFVSVIPITIAILWLQRYWRGGLTSGSVKG
jgi:multiple sugar transport system permease protein